MLTDASAAYLDNPEELRQILHSFISFFITLGVFSSVILIAVIVTLIMLLKSNYEIHTFIS